MRIANTFLAMRVVIRRASIAFSVFARFTHWEIAAAEIFGILKKTEERRAACSACAPMTRRSTIMRLKG
jgi:hypothetical protein